MDMTFTADGLVSLLALTVNLVVLIRVAVKLERRLTRIETVIEISLPHLEKRNND